VEELTKKQKMETLNKNDLEFVNKVAVTGNQTQSAKDAYGIKNDGYARKKGSVQVTKRNIATAIEEVRKSLAERIPDELLEKVHLEGLNAGKTIVDEDDNILATIPDYATRHKYLDSGYKLKGSYAPDKAINLNIQTDITNPKARELAEEYEAKLKQTL